MPHTQPTTSTSLLARLHARMGDFWWYSLTSIFSIRKDINKSIARVQFWRDDLLALAIGPLYMLYSLLTRVVRPEPPECGEVLANGEKYFSPLFFW